MSNLSQDPALQEQVRSLFAEVFQVSLQEIPSDLAFGDLPQWDSMGHMDIIMGLEQRFGIEANTDLISELTSIQAICEYLAEKKGRG